MMYSTVSYNGYKPDKICLYILCIWEIIVILFSCNCIYYIGECEMLDLQKHKQSPYALQWQDQEPEILR